MLIIKNKTVSKLSKEYKEVCSRIKNERTYKDDIKRAKELKLLIKIANNLWNQKMNNRHLYSFGYARDLAKDANKKIFEIIKAIQMHCNVNTFEKAYYEEDRKEHFEFKLINPKLCISYLNQFPNGTEFFLKRGYSIKKYCDDVFFEGNKRINILSFSENDLDGIVKF